MGLDPLVILAIGIVTVVGMIIVLRINAFIALITAAILVSLLAPGPAAEKITRVAEEFGRGAGKIGIVIALAAVIGQCMMDSGAADRIVRAFMRLLGEKRSPWALMGSGYVLAIPVFFDTVFYLLVPLARSFYRRTGRNYLLCLLAIAAGGAITHTLVPPTPGPLAMAANLGVDLGIMIGVGALVALPAAVVGILFSAFLDRRMPIPMRQVSDQPEPEPLGDDELPPLFVSLLPVVLPVLMIAAQTVADTMAKQEIANEAPGTWVEVRQYTAILGDPNFALLVSTAIALFILQRQRRPTLEQLSRLVEASLMSGGLIILITAAGVAFGEMLKVAEIGPRIQGLFGDEGGTGIALLFLGFGIAALLKIAQGSSTAAMIIASGMLAALVAEPSTLGYHPVYLATAIGAGSLIGSWMNDSGFWIFAKMGGLTEVEALKSWTPMLVVLGCVAMTTTVVLALVLPLRHWI